MFGKKSNKTKIVLIPDVLDWAFGNISKQIKKNLDDYFDIKIIPSMEVNERIEEIKACDIIHFFWREMIRYVFPINSNNFPSGIFKKKIISTAVYDQSFLNEENIKERIKLFNNTSYYVSSQRLMDIYSNIKEYKPPKMVIEDGVDPDLFYPINLDRLKNKGDKPLVIGWAGNSKWGGPKEDFKGFRTIIKPAVHKLIQEGYKIEGLYRDKNDGFIPHDKMVDYYSNIDILVCMSKIEGTPNPVLEAMACGVPIITTDVGIVPQVFGEKQKKFILKNRDIPTFTDAILQLYNNRNMMVELSEENLTEIKKWYWNKQCLKFEMYFKELEKNLK